MDAVFRQRKFALAFLFSITSVIALFTGQIQGGEFIGLVATILALYGGANVATKAVTK